MIPLQQSFQSEWREIQRQAPRVCYLTGVGTHIDMVQVVAATIEQGKLTGPFRQGSRLRSAPVLSGQLHVNQRTANKA
jgi:hypothetical protein